MELVDSRELFFSLLISSFLSPKLISSFSLDHSDDDLVRVLTEATEEVAGAFKARGAVSFLSLTFLRFKLY